MERDRSYLHDIYRFAHQILQFVEPLDELSFAALEFLLLRFSAQSHHCYALRQT